MAAITLFSSNAGTLTYERNPVDWANRIALSTPDGRSEEMFVTTKNASDEARKITRVLEDLALKIEAAKLQGTALPSEEAASGIHAIIQALIKIKGIPP